MRELKFRVWDTVDECFLDSFGLNQDGFVFEYDASGYGFVNPDYIYVMQYTGVKDVNGVDIYEGDIIKWEYDNECLGIGVVEYSVGDACYTTHDIKGELNGFNTAICSRYAVIGNVYENPELIKEN